MLKSSWAESGGHVRERLTQTQRCGFHGTDSSSSRPSARSPPGCFQVALWFATSPVLTFSFPSGSMTFTVLLLRFDWCWPSFWIMPVCLSDRNEIERSRMFVFLKSCFSALSLLPETNAPLCWNMTSPSPPSEMEFLGWLNSLSAPSCLFAMALISVPFPTVD